MRGSIKTPPRRRLSQLGGSPGTARPTWRPRRSTALPLVVSMSHVTPAGLGSQVSCPRAHARPRQRRSRARHVTYCEGEIAGMRREITVLNNKQTLWQAPRAMERVKMQKRSRVSHVELCWRNNWNLRRRKARPVAGDNNVSRSGYSAFILHCVFKIRATRSNRPIHGPTSHRQNCYKLAQIAQHDHHLISAK